MERSSSTIYRQLGIAAEDRRIDLLWMLLWTIAALLLYTWQLGDLPLRDWDEGIVATVAREIWRSRFDQSVWLFPQYIDGAPYINKPPLMHWLVSIAYLMGGVNESMARLPGALLSAISVPLLYWVGREMFYRRLPAIFAAGVYLTYLPVVRQGRLAMLDGAILCFLILMWGCLLRSRRDFRWSLGIGASIGLMCLTKGLLGIVLGAIGLAFLLWDTPRIFRSGYFWLGLLLGMMPVIGWYSAQYEHYGLPFIQAHFLEQSLNRVGQAVERNAGSVWFYLLEILKYGSIWLVFIPLGIRLLWRDWHLSWAKMLSLWFGSYFLIISVMQTKLPWYAMPLYPAIALLVGASLTDLWEPAQQNLMAGIRIPAHRLWAGTFFTLSGLVLSALIYYLLQGSEPDLVLICGTLAMTLMVAGITALQQSRQFILVLIWGSYLTLLGFVSSEHWVWELAERPAVKPIAALVKRHTPAKQPVYTTAPESRPSLEFYSDRRIIPTNWQWLEATKTPQTTLTVLVPQSDLAIAKTITSKSFKPIAQIEGWAIVEAKPTPAASPNQPQS
ncbi:glycosyltransferase family 39 protein [filamentous cyanobacterium LEGE 11480]|uniref:Glycosyltransferase family 39 protein n=1 Tax=Romeriopsis navalis LEGE 11480 TaxID=2777977 RepID=A0A928VLY3_9CYAN|nr:glycosyltransferase family 39 protein [Romeriopsis navalis]MBE9028439.1 glycosyltransferase family 39 protein [Romeriopsis navalis LEGE 11480]